jgi:3-phosphoshikimate 1-carboxyvinyltransferase
MPLQGKFYPPGDKSISHRIILLALAAGGQCEISHLSPCADVDSSLRIYLALGGRARQNADSLLIHGLQGKLNPSPAPLDCGNSGTTMRLLCGLLASSPGSFSLDGDAMLRRRPMGRVIAPLTQMGADIKGEHPPLNIRGRTLHGIDYDSPLASAQVKSAVLLAGLRADGQTSYREAMPSRNHTEILLRACGAQLQTEHNTTTLIPGPITLPADFNVPGDASGAAFFLTAAAFIPHSDVSARQVSLNPGRIGFLKVLERMGAGVEISGPDEPGEAKGLEPQGNIRVFYNGPLRAARITAQEVPGLVDEIPVLALAAAQAQGTSVFQEVGELKVKETDRLLALRRQLSLLGAQISIKGNDLIIKGKGKLLPPSPGPTALDSAHDHRMAMTLALALKSIGLDLPIKGADSAAISYPDFYSDLAWLWKD